MLSEVELPLAEAREVETSLFPPRGVKDRDPSTRVFFASEED